MPSYVVEVKLSCHILVTDAQDKDEAIEFAQCSAHFGDAQWFEMEAQPIEDREVEGWRRMADVVSEDE